MRKAERKKDKETERDFTLPLSFSTSTIILVFWV
jgi:hypothetical protein